MRLTRSTMAWLALVLLLSANTAKAREYHVDRDRDRLVRFICDAPFENFDGVTELVDGYVEWEGDSLSESADLLDNSHLYFEVRLDGLDTGIGLRNRHMRDNYLETEKYPYAHFTGRLTQVERDPTGGFTVTADGVFHVHGVDRQRIFIATVSPVGDGFHVRGSFEVKLSDHNIGIPKIMFLKINEIIELEIDFFLSPAGDTK